MEVQEVQEVPNEANFRLNRKFVHLTFKFHHDKQGLLDWVKKPPSATREIEFVWYSVCHHRGDEEVPYDHTHIAFESRRKLDVRNSRFWDIPPGSLGNQSLDAVHPHIQPINDLHHAGTIYENYHRKDEGFLGPPLQSERGPMSGKDLMERIKAAPDLRTAALLAGVVPKSIVDLKILRDER